MDRTSKLAIGRALFVIMPVVVWGILRLTGLVALVSLPSSSMKPTIAPGDRMMVEGITFLARAPRRGEMIVFRTDNIMGLQPGAKYVKRVAGEPGDQVRISEGKLYINGKHLPLVGADGEIVYRLPSGSEQMAITNNVAVPPGNYFVLGDNSEQSLDSRFFGFVQAKDILGRVIFRYWPYERAGRVK